MNSKLLKLARLVMKFAEMNTDKGVLIFEGDLEIGVEVSLEDAEGNILTAPDGEYTLEDNRVVIVTEGKVTEIKEVPEDEPTDEPTEDTPVDDVKLEDDTPSDDPVDEPKDEPEDDKDKIIAEQKQQIEDLIATLTERDITIEQLNTKIAELEAMINAPVDEPLDFKATPKPENDIYDKIKNILG